MLHYYIYAVAARASAVELVGGQCYCCACGTYSNGIGCCYDDHGNQLSNSPPSPELSCSVSFFYCPDRAQRAF
jgi:hypothetical protein